jgi:RND family efflux transporter MFP subunit
MTMKRTDLKRCLCRPPGKLAWLLVFGLAPGALGCGSHAASGAAQQATGPAGPPPVVRVTTVALQSWPQVVRVQGTLAADEEVIIGAKVAGRVKTVPVDRGTEVGANAVLAELELEEFDLRVKQAEAQLEQVRAKLGLEPGERDETLNRFKAPPVVQEQALLDEARFLLARARGLLRQNAVTVEDVQRLEAALRVAEARYASALNTVDEQIALLATRRAELALARQQRTDAVIRAPFSGFVQERHTAPGAFLNVGDPVVVLVKTDPLRFRAGVPERESARVAVGQSVRIHVEGRTEPLTATVTRISPALHPASRAVIIEADVPNPGGRLRAGVFAEGDIVVDPAARVLAVPAAALTEFAGVEKVWVVRDGTAREQRVRTGRRERGRVEILDGLAAGDVILADARQGRAGPVTVAP